MAIETNQYIGYDTAGHYYYLTMVGAEFYTGYDLSNEWASGRTKKQGRQLHRWYTKSPYNGVGIRKNHRDIVEYSIFKDDNGERQNVIDMLIEFVEASYDSDWDRITYEEGKTSKMPPSVVEVGEMGQVKFTGRVYYTVPEDEYQEGY